MTGTPDEFGHGVVVGVFLSAVVSMAVWVGATDEVTKEEANLICSDWIEVRALRHEGWPEPTALENYIICPITTKKFNHKPWQQQRSNDNG